MGFTVTGLTNYVNQESQNLIAAQTFMGETAALAQVQTGIKSAATLQVLSTAANILAGGTCGFTGTDGATFTQRTITTGAFKYEATWCPADLEAKWTQMLLKAGQTYNESDIPAKIVDEYVAKIVENLETLDWTGDTGGSAGVNKYTGLIKIIDDAYTAGAGVVIADGVDYTVANARVAVNNIIRRIPAALKGKSTVQIVMGYDMYESYLAKLAADDLFNKAASFDVYGEIQAEFTNYKIKALHGLDGTGRAFAFEWSNIYMGVDMEGEQEEARMWVDGSDMQTVKMRVAGRRGWQVAIPSEIVSFTDSSAGVY